MKIYDPKKILVALDFSDLCMGILRAGVEIGKLRGTEVTVLHVGKESEHRVTGGYTAEAGRIIPLSKLLDDARMKVESRLESMLREVSAGPKVKSVFLWGDPAKDILSLAETGDYDLIIMGTHGRNKLSRFLLGSVTEQVIRRAPCPVLIIRDKVVTKELGEREMQRAAMN